MALVRPGVLPPAAGDPVRGTFRDPEVPHHGRGRGPDERERQPGGRPPRDPPRPLPAPVVPRRAATAVQRAARRHEPGWPASGDGGVRDPARARGAPGAHRAHGHRRAVHAGVHGRGGRSGRRAGSRRLLPDHDGARPGPGRPGLPRPSLLRLRPGAARPAGGGHRQESCHEGRRAGHPPLPPAVIRRASGGRRGRPGRAAPGGGLERAAGVGRIRPAGDRRNHGAPLGLAGHRCPGRTATG